MFYVLCFTFYVLRFTFYVLRFTFYVLRFMFYVLCERKYGLLYKLKNKLFTGAKIKINGRKDI